jgi:hypothetical protein
VSADRPEPNVRSEGSPEPERPSRYKLVASAFVLALLGVLVYRWWTQPAPPTEPGAPSATPPAVPRCAEVAPGKSFVVGEQAPSKSAPAPGASADPDAQPDRDDMLAPFAVVLGRAIATGSGYAVGFQGEGEGGSVAQIALVSADASGGTTVKLSRSRGDLDPPVVASAPGGSLLVALLEANAGGRAVRLAKIDGTSVTWGAELPEGRDESLAVDVAVGTERGIVAWDAVDGERSHVAIATFAAGEVGRASPPRRITAEETDAEAPRVSSFEGGFYVVYMARGEVRPRQAARPPDAAERASPAASGKPEVDEERGGEPVASTWLEVIVVDPAGSPSADPVRIGADGGHIVSFDVATAADGSLTVAYREESSPTGAGGGPVRVVRVAAGSAPSDPYTSSDDVPSDGAPTLLPGWIGVPTLRGPDLLARLGSNGLPVEALEIEPSFGRGEPIAASGARLLLAEPRGKAMRLVVVECGDRAAIGPKDEPGVSD